MLTNDRTRRILLKFAPEPRSISQVADALGEPVSTIFYHVTGFVRQGLLIVAREERRQGKPIKFYESVAKSFLLPRALTDRPCTQGLAEELRQALDSVAEEAEFEGVLFSADADGGIIMNLSSDVKAARRQSPAGEIWHIVRLSDEAAASLASELSALLARYEGLPGGGREFLVHAALAPRRTR